MEKKFGLIGKSLKHSLSKAYFDEKFFRDKLFDYRYDLYEIANFQALKKFLKTGKNLCGLNITIPYKEKAIGLLDKIDKSAQDVGAVNVVKVKEGKLIGYNTDSEAFACTLKKWFPISKTSRAILLGTGGVSKAVQHALKKLNVPFKLVSRISNASAINYEELKENKLLSSHQLIINTTPVGMFPETSACPLFPYEEITHDHFVYDLIYNPARTVFLQKAEMHGATIKNGLEMLHVQAEKAWNIWENNC